MMNQYITVGYNPNDFLYTKATDQVLPSDSQCTDPSSNGYVFVNTIESCNPFPTPSEEFMDVINDCKTKADSLSSSSSGLGCNIYDNCQENTDFMNCLRDTDLSKSTFYYHPTYESDYVKWVEWQDSSFNCYQRELCNNKKLAKEIQKMQNDHLGSDQSLKDSSYIYMDQYIKSINLGVGILLLLGIIFYSK
jgi:hypothetical protein